MIRHSFVNKLSSIDENVESTRIEEKEKHQWEIRHNAAMHLQDYDEISTDELSQSGQPKDSWTVRNVKSPQFYDGCKPKYCLFHRSWKRKIKIKGNEPSEQLNMAIANDKQVLGQGNPTKNGISSKITPPYQEWSDTFYFESSGRTRYRLNYLKRFISCKRCNRPSKPLAMKLNENTWGKCNDGKRVSPLRSDGKRKIWDDRIVSKISSSQDRARYKSLRIEKLSRDKLKELFLKVGWRPFPTLSESSDLPTLSPMSSTSSDFESDEDQTNDCAQISVRNRTLK